MCGRYTIFATLNEIRNKFSLLNNINFPASYNAAPSQSLPIVVNNQIKLSTWGLRPAWAKSKDMRPQINARSETASEKPFFRDAFKSHRCLVPANGFFEWGKIKGGKQPWYFSDDNKLLAFAGLYNEDGFCVLTKPAIAPVKDVHGRMPVILSPEHYTEWLNSDVNSANALLQSANYTLDANVVSDRVNTPANNDESLILSNQLF